MTKDEFFKLIEKKKEYSFDEVSKLLGVDTPKVRTWRDIGIFTLDKTQVIRLQVKGEEKDRVSGKDLISFLRKNDLNALGSTIFFLG